MEKLAVIGSNCFSGSHFVDYLLENTNYNIVGISRADKNSVFLPYQGKENNRFKFYELDLNKDMDRILEAMIQENVTKVVNFAAQGMVGQSWDMPVHWYRTNVVSIVDLVERLRKIPSFKKYLQISTPEVYGSCDNITEDATYDPSSPYANSKVAADIHLKLIHKQFGFPVVFARSTNVYGPGQQLFRIIPISIIKIKLGKKIQLHGGGEAVKSYIHIKDTCDGYFKILEHGRPGEVYHLSPDSGCSIKSIVEMICDKLGVPFEQAVEIVEERTGQDAKYIINSNKARAELNWRPKITIDQGIDECIEWVNKNWENIKKLPLEYIHKE